MEYLHEKLQAIINHSSENEVYKYIAKVIIENLPNIDKFTIEHIAQLSFTSVSTVSRFIKLLGFNNFIEFRQDFKHYDISRMLQINDVRGGFSVKNHKEVNFYIDNLIASLQSLKDNIDFEKIDKINELIHNSKNIAISGSLFPASIAQFYQIYLLYIGKYIAFYNFFEPIDRASIDNIDLFIFFSVEGNFINAHKEVLLSLKLENKKLVLLTQNPKIFISSIFDEILYLGEHENVKSGNYKLLLYSEILLSRYCEKYLSKSVF